MRIAPVQAVLLAAGAVGVSLVAGVPGATPALGQEVAGARPIGTMSDLMAKVIYPASDAVFYIETRTPKTDAEWSELQGKTLILAESANLLMMPGRARDQDRWTADTRLMLDAGTEAFKAAKRHDVAGLVAVNDALYTSCVTCHRHYRPNYGRGSAGGPGNPADRE
jgi:hypothetical protein